MATNPVKNGIDDRTFEREVVQGNDFSEPLTVSQFPGISSFAARIKWLDRAWDDVSAKIIPGIGEEGILPYDLSPPTNSTSAKYLISLSPEQTIILPINRPIYGDIDLYSGDNQIVRTAARIKLLVRGSANARD